MLVLTVLPQVPVQRVTRYPLLLSRLVKVTPGGHSDKEALQEAQEKVEAGLDTMNQETTRDTGTTKLWRRISMINTPYRRSEQQIDLLGTTTWGVRKVRIIISCIIYKLQIIIKKIEFQNKCFALFNLAANDSMVFYWFRPVRLTELD